MGLTSIPITRWREQNQRRSSSNQTSSQVKVGLRNGTQNTIRKCISSSRFVHLCRSSLLVFNYNWFKTPLMLSKESLFEVNLLFNVVERSIEKHLEDSFFVCLIDLLKITKHLPLRRPDEYILFMLHLWRTYYIISKNGYQYHMKLFSTQIREERMTNIF